MKEFGKVFDRNGREIHVGDRIKIRGDEMRVFLKTLCGDFLTESDLADVKDDFGTVVIDDELLQIVNENGDMLWDLTTNFEESDPCLEIVGSDYQECSTTTERVEKQCTGTSNVTTAPLISWFGEETGSKMLQTLSKKYPTQKKMRLCPFNEKQRGKNRRHSKL